MGDNTFTEGWRRLAGRYGIQLPGGFLDLLDGIEARSGLAWRFLTAEEAERFKSELDERFDYPDRQWRGIPFARSTVSEDVACFDLDTPAGREAEVLPVRDWHGPRWEFWGDRRSFVQWLASDGEGRLT
ncbi:MAG: hypothetical protein JSV26_10185 [bacterium]|nr:MAG: hypothetical protein JSV26_10185 [bacterium]